MAMIVSTLLSNVEGQVNTKLWKVVSNDLKLSTEIDKKQLLHIDLFLK